MEENQEIVVQLNGETLALEEYVFIGRIEDRFEGSIRASTGVVLHAIMELAEMLPEDVAKAIINKDALVIISSLHFETTSNLDTGDSHD